MDRLAAERALAGLRRRQDGAFTRAQAVALGVPGSTVDARCTRGHYRQLLPGVLTGAGIPDSWSLRARAAVLHVGREAVLARQSAARLHGIELPASVDDGLHLLVRTRTLDLPAGITVHRTRQLSDHDRAVVRGLPVTSAARTVCDLAPVLGRVALRRAVAQSVRSCGVDAAALRTMLARLGRVRGKTSLLALCDELSPLDAACRSQLETDFLRLATRAGIPPTAINHPVVDADGYRRYLDAAYLPERLPVELDSSEQHGTLLDWHDDLERENRIVLVGWASFQRFSHFDVIERPGEVVRRLRSALGAARATTNQHSARPAPTNPMPT